MPPTERLTIHIRVTPDMLKRLKRSAIDGGRSMNAEVVARLERSFAKHDQDRNEAVKLLADALSLLDRGRK